MFYGQCFEELFNDELNDLKDFAEFYQIDAEKAEVWYKQKVCFLVQNDLWRRFYEDNKNLFNEGIDIEFMIQNFIRGRKEEKQEAIERCLKKPRIFKAIADADADAFVLDFLPLSPPRPTSLNLSSSSSSSSSSSQLDTCDHEIENIKFPYFGKIDANVCQAIKKNNGLYSQCRLKISNDEHELCKECNKRFNNTNGQKWYDFIANRDEFLRRENLFEKDKDCIKIYMGMGQTKFFKCCFEKYAKSHNFYFDPQIIN
jgi:hypothetical protein